MHGCVVSNTHRRMEPHVLGGCGLDGINDTGAVVAAGFAVTHMRRCKTSKHLCKMLGCMAYIAAMTEHFQEVVIADKVEARETGTLLLEVLAQRRLNAVQELGEAFERGLDPRNADDVEHIRRFQHLFQQRKKLAAHALEACAFDRQDMHHALGAPTAKHAVQVHPLPLHISPQVKHRLDPSESVLPHTGLFFKHAVVRACRHSAQATCMLVCLEKQCIPATQQHALVAVVD